jgi:hypothetical protein
MRACLETQKLEQLEALCVPKTSSVLIARPNRLNVSGDDGALLPLPGPVRLAVQVKEPTCGRERGAPTSIDCAAAEGAGSHPTQSAAVALHRETRTIPVVFAQVPDPVGLGMVESLSRPGGNVTGFSSAQMDIEGKGLEIFKDMVPGLARVVVLVPRIARNLFAPTQEAARTSRSCSNVFRLCTM